MEGQKPPTGVQERSPLGAFGDEVHQKLVIYCNLYCTVKIQRAVFMQWLEAHLNPRLPRWIRCYSF